jgi:hypothetical protein
MHVDRRIVGTDLTAIAWCERAWQSVHRSVAKTLKRTVALNIACRDSLVVDDNANSDVRKGGS